MNFEKKKLKIDLYSMSDFDLLAKKGEEVETYRNRPEGCLWIKVGETHMMIFSDEEEEYFD